MKKTANIIVKKDIVALLSLSLVLNIIRLIAEEIFIFKNKALKNNAKKNTKNFIIIIFYLLFNFQQCKDMTKS